MAETLLRAGSLPIRALANRLRGPAELAVTGIAMVVGVVGIMGLSYAIASQGSTRW